MDRAAPGADKRSFLLGMVAAFCECAAGGCKRLALSPPLTREEYRLYAGEATGVIEKHGLRWYHEENADRPEAERFDWILIAGKQETIEEYLALRARGYSPAESLAPFSGLLSYNPAESVHTGYDAWKAYFPGEQEE